MGEVERLCQDVEDVSWMTLRALAQEYGMRDPNDLPDRDKQLLWMGIKAGCAGATEVLAHHRHPR